MQGERIEKKCKGERRGVEGKGERGRDTSRRQPSVSSYSIGHSTAKVPSAQPSISQSGAPMPSPAVVGTVGLDAAALGALVDHLARLQLQALYELLGGVPLRHRPLERERGERHRQSEAYP